MIRVLIVCVACVLAAPAVAQTANQRAEHEARTYFVNCSHLPKDKKADCLSDQTDFLDSYLRAKSGDVEYIHDIANYCDPGSHFAGIFASKRQQCAWLIVREEVEADEDARSVALNNYRFHCLPISPNELQAVIDRADELLYELRTEPTKPPPERHIDTRCLDSTVTPFSADPDPSPPPPPPPGCPRR